MKAASVAEIKRELATLPDHEVMEICLRLAKFKKDNKELLTYLLYESRDEESYIQSIKRSIDEEMAVVNTSHMYFAKKTVRKVLRNATRLIRYSGSKQTEIEVLIHFCGAIQQLPLPLARGTVLSNIFERQLVKIRKAMSTLHEDLQADYQMELNDLLEH